MTFRVLRQRILQRSLVYLIGSFIEQYIHIYIHVLWLRLCLFIMSCFLTMCCVKSCFLTDTGGFQRASHCFRPWQLKQPSYLPGRRSSSWGSWWWAGWWRPCRAARWWRRAAAAAWPARRTRCSPSPDASGRHSSISPSFYLFHPFPPSFLSLSGCHRKASTTPPAARELNWRLQSTIQSCVQMLSQFCG